MQDVDIAPYAPIDPVPSMMAVTVDNALEFPLRLSWVPCSQNVSVERKLCLISHCILTGYQKLNPGTWSIGLPMIFGSYQVSRYSGCDESVRSVHQASTQKQHCCMRNQKNAWRQPHSLKNNVYFFATKGPFPNISMKTVYSKDKKIVYVVHAFFCLSISIVMVSQFWRS